MKEIRSFDLTAPSEESRNIEGYGVVFGKESVDLGGFTEIIAPGAITDEVIRNSDIFLLLDHSRERGVLARSRYGEGSLSVSVDEQGVYYHCDAPRTALGDEVLEGIRRKDIGKCSFAFTVAEDKWSKDADGKVLRTITAIDRIYDLSIVYSPAYEDTIVVNKRGLEEMEEPEKEETPTEDPEQGEEERSEGPTEQEEAPNEEPEPEPEQEEEERAVETETNVDNLYPQKDNQLIKRMNKFSLIRAISDVVSRKAFDEATENLIKEGRAAANLSGVSANGQIVIPVEMRAEGDPAPATPTKPVNGLMATEAEIGKEVVPTDLWDVLGALRDRLVLAQAGAQIISAQANLELPVYDGSNVFWESEIGEAKDGAGKFSKIALSPKRMTAFVDISKQLINQTSASVESMIRADLVNAIAEKLQKTILGNGAGSDVEPKGLLNGITADANAFAYNDAVDMEATLESANVYGNFAYIVNPQAKAALRCTNVDKGSGRFVWEDNEILGIPAYSTNGVVTKGAILADWSQLVIANFGALDITIDEISRAAYGQIRIVVNFYVDYGVKRPSAFVKRILK